MTRRRPAAVLEYIGGPQDGFRREHNPVTGGGPPLPGYGAPAQAQPLPGLPADRWVARWEYPRSGGQPKPYCSGVWRDDRGWKQPCGRGCPAFRRTQ